jgi:hypothetical protein
MIIKFIHHLIQSASKYFKIFFYGESEKNTGYQSVILLNFLTDILSVKFLIIDRHDSFSPFSKFYHNFNKPKWRFPCQIDKD